MRNLGASVLTLLRVTGSLRLEVVHDPRLCFAMQQNGVAPVQLVRVHNDGVEEVRDLQVSLALTPDLGGPWVARIAAIPAGGTYNLDQPELEPSAAALANVEERVRGAICAEVTQSGVLQTRVELPIEVLAYNEWPGAGSLPALLAAFVLPNHPVVATILRAASDRLAVATGNGALDGYQSASRERVRAIAQSIYEALQSFGIAYVHPPASFEQQGQKVRTPEQVLGERLGTCLDLALLYAACLEQAGLHPLVVLVDGHAASGVWLEAETFAEPTPADPLPLRKRVELGRMLVVECTTVCSTQAQPFDVACELGARILKQGPESDSGSTRSVRNFLFALDVKAARRAKIAPIPQRRANFATELAADAEVPRGAPSSAVGVVVPAPQPRVIEEPGDRLQRWQRRLLDLTLRNRLLNFVPTKRTIALQTYDVTSLVAAMEGGAEFELVPAGNIPPEGWNEHEDYERRRRRLCVPLGEDELARRQLEIWRATRTTHEESGVNSLFLAVGFLRWFETASSKEPRRAPLLLIPLRIERVSLVDGFVVALADEDARINDTLLQKLQRDFDLRVDGLESDNDEDGLDPAAVLDAFRRAIVDVPRWEVEPTASIGNFSFAKYLMWADLQDRRAELLAHPILAHLVESPDRAFEQDAQWPNERELDQQEPASLYCPKDADSSQLVAVRAAADGLSFVLEGPPGTGKSQTITNLIAQNLALGKRVLFVAEKRAALEVVQRRLADSGLAPFCLELHSGKGTRKDVVQQLDRALQFGQVTEPAAWRLRAGELEGVRRQLNDLVDALHRARMPGCSVFDAVAQAVSLRSAPLVDGIPVAVTQEQRALQRACVDTFAATAAEVGEPRQHPWWGVRRREWRPELMRSLPPKVASAQEACAAMARAVSEVGARLGMPSLAVASRTQVQQLVALAAALSAGPLPAELLTARDFASSRSWVEQVAAVGAAGQAGWQRLQAAWREELLAMPLVGWIAQIERLRASFALVRWWRMRPIRQQLAGVHVVGNPPRGEELIADLKVALQVCDHRTALQRVDSEGRARLGFAWRGLDTDWSKLGELLDRCEAVRSVVASLVPSNAVWDVLARCAETSSLPEAARTELSQLGDADAAWQQALQLLAEPLDLDVDAAMGGADELDHLGRARARLDGFAANPSRLREWCAYQRDAHTAREAGLGPILDGLESASFGCEQLAKVYERSFAEGFLHATWDADPALAEFRGQDHERLIARFRALDQELIALAGQVVQARLAAQLPRVQSTNASSSELGILLRETKKQRRHLSPRQLFARIPNLLPRLAPCLLMSPLTVAQVLGPSTAKFDLVVFDEASQVPVWDAVGAIGRGKSLVVVGDSKQLPPTSFFQRLDAEELLRDAAEEQVEELESVLDECSAAGLRKLYLRWHYRSQHESLITFSNHHYYENRLFTFPSADRGGALGVRFMPVAGVYDRAKSQQNRPEAEALVGALVQRLRDPQLSRYSHGVVTFSQPQQVLVEDLLEQARQQYPEIERHFAGSEGVFVKNLENVQGDERDVMLFSICYGPDAAGKVHMNFGPLNQQGGERRLNVAVTRARRELLVFSSLRAEQIELQRTQSLGVRHLRAFLDYAARGVQAITEAVAREPGSACESPFEREVKMALESLGHEVHAQIGCSGYRIDLAVVDPRQKGRYLIGVECDGASYHSAATARDRDRLRQGVLERLGWRLCRIWSTDWWQDAAGELQRVHKAIEAALRVPVAVASPLPAPELAAPVGAVPVSAASSPLANASPAVPSVALDPQPAVASAPRAEVAPLLRYQTTVLQVSKDSDGLWSPRRTAQVQLQIESVLRAEAPIDVELLVRRIASAWGIGRVTARVRDHIRTLADGLALVHETVLWCEDQVPADYRDFRTSPAGAADRDAEHLPPIEVANAIAWLLAQHGSMSEEECVREAARQFGFTRVGAAVRSSMLAGLDLALQHRGVGREGGLIRLS